MSKPEVIAGRYTLLRRLGAGAMGTVWLARDETLHREGGIKQGTGPALAEGAEEQRQRPMRAGRRVAGGGGAREGGGGGGGREGGRRVVAGDGVRPVQDAHRDGPRRGPARAGTRRRDRGPARRRAGRGAPGGRDAPRRQAGERAAG